MRLCQYRSYPVGSNVTSQVLSHMANFENSLPGFPTDFSVPITGKIFNYIIRAANEQRTITMIK